MIREELKGLGMREIIFKDEVRLKIKNGIGKLARAVKSTLGPKGKYVSIERGVGYPTVTKDGVTVARVISLKDKYENLGAQMLKEVASKTGDEAGDGTTTATVLAESIYLEGLKNIAAGSSSVEIKRGIDISSEILRSEIKNMSKPLGDEDIERVATLSANSDKVVGKLISEAMKKAGKYGVVACESGSGLTSKLESMEGMQFNKGYISAYFATNSNKGLSELYDPYILLVDKKISSVVEVDSILQYCATNGKSLLIIAEDVEGDPLATMIINNNRKTLKSCAVRAPGFGEGRMDTLEDIAILTGGKVFRDLPGDIKYEGNSIVGLGRCEKATITRATCSIIGGKGSDNDIANRLEELNIALDEQKDPYEKDILENRLAKLSTGVSIIKVGGATETEMRERKDRVDDAICATKAAQEEGYVLGGGISLLKLSKKLGKELKNRDLMDGEKIGIRVVMRALEEPLRVIAENAGYSGDIVINEALRGKKGFGFDARIGEFCNLEERGIIDPAKVTRSAIQNACSIAGLLLTTETMISELSKD